MLCTISTRLQVDMFAQSMSLNFCNYKQDYPKGEFKSMQFGPILGSIWVACSNALSDGFVIVTHNWKEDASGISTIYTLKYLFKYLVIKKLGK
jgi:hypothetical protein